MSLSVHLLISLLMPLLGVNGWEVNESLDLKCGYWPERHGVLETGTAGYRASLNDLKFEALPPEPARRGKDSLVFTISYGNEDLDEWTIQTTFSRPQFSSLFGCFLSDERLIASGCDGDNAQFVYVAETQRADEGMGVWCAEPRINPGGPYIFFLAPNAKVTPRSEGHCAYLLDCSEAVPSAYRVYPLLGDQAERLVLVADTADSSWFGLTKRDAACRPDKLGRLCSPLSITNGTGATHQG